MQTYLIHSELNVWFDFRFSIDYEHHLITTVGNQILEMQVTHRYNIGDDVLNEPHTVVVAVHCCFVGHCRLSAIALRSHFRF